MPSRDLPVNPDLTNGLYTMFGRYGSRRLSHGLAKARHRLSTERSRQSSAVGETSWRGRGEEAWEEKVRDDRATVEAAEWYGSLLRLVKLYGEWEVGGNDVEGDLEEVRRERGGGRRMLLFFFVGVMVAYLTCLGLGYGAVIGNGVSP